MIKISQADIGKARDLIANGNPEAVGYKLLIKPIDAKTEMDEALAKDSPMLAQMGFVDKTDEHADKLSKGTQHGILAHIGAGAFVGGTWEHCTNFPKEGEVIIFDRYCGVEMELPPGSGEKYRFANDEALLGMVK